jgi:2-keto-4-pentenoate hydratase
MEHPPRLLAALERQFQSWRRLRAQGVERVGWKVGAGQRECIEGGMVIGHLTSATLLPSGASYRVRKRDADLHADAEVAVELGRDLAGELDLEETRAAINGFGPALEIVDLASSNDAESIVAENVFHRAVAFGSSWTEVLPPQVEGRLVVNGAVRAADGVDFEVVARVAEVAALLGALGERLEAGDRIITGSVVQVPVAEGQLVVADLGGLGQVRLSINGL